MTIDNIELGDRFVNLLDSRGADMNTRELIRLGGMNITSDLLAIMGRFGRGLSPFDGGILYIPPGMTALLQSPPDQPIIVPSHVLLKFGPTARLHLTNGTILVIMGMVEARPDQIFEFDSPLAENRGRIVFASDRILEVHPEWFGASVSTDAPDPVIERHRVTVAMQDCIDAVHRHRQVYGRHPAMRVDLRQDYHLADTLYVGRAPDPAVASVARWDGVFGDRHNHDGVLLRGGGMSSKTGFHAFRPQPLDPRQRTAGTFPRLPTMLRMVGVQGSRIEGVAFKGEWDAEVCVQLWNPFEAAGRAGLPSGALNVFRHCAMFGVRRAQVEVGPRLNRLPFLASPPRDEDHSGTLFEQCRFEFEHPSPIPANYGDPTSVPLSEVVLIRASRTRPVTFRNCLFGNAALACWRVEAGSVFIDGTTAHNEAVPGALWILDHPLVSIPGRPGLQFPTRETASTLGGLASPGTDVYLPDFPSSGEKGDLGRVTVMHHESQSTQGIDTFRGISRGQIGPFAPNVVVMNTHFNETSGGGRIPSRNSIWWDGPGRRPTAPGGNVAVAGTLLLVNVNFGASMPGFRMGLPIVQGRTVVHEGVYAVYDLGGHAANLDGEDQVFGVVRGTSEQPARLLWSPGRRWLFRPRSQTAPRTLVEI